MNPIKNETFAFLNDFFQEISEVFPDDYVHIGGDEVGYECWESNASIQNYVQQNNISLEELKDDFNVKAAKIVTDNIKTPMVWEEVLSDNMNLKLSDETIIQVWKPFWKIEIATVTKNNWSTILSSCWYLDHLDTGGDWLKFYTCEPTDFPGTGDQHQLVLGGEACMWSESVSNANIVSRIFPRASATAEKLWSDVGVNNSTEAAPRLEEQTCRMVNRGIPAQPPNGAGFC